MGRTKNGRISLAMGLALALAWGLGACDKGPAEKAGEKVDHAVSTATTSVKDAAKDVQQGGQPGH
jgi:hypothetical protein